MPLGPYSPCPGGKQKKVKFCCADIQNELQQISHMAEEGQPRAALNLIERVEKKHPDRACLMALKANLLDVLGETEQAGHAAEAFRAKHPDNPIALGESAIAEIQQGHAREAVQYVVQAIEASGEQIHGQLLDTIAIVCHGLDAAGHLLASRMLRLFHFTFNREDREVLEAIVRMNSSPAVPLVVREERVLLPVAEGAPWKPQADAAEDQANRGHWNESLKRLTALVQQAPESPVAWHNLALVRAWMADDEGAAEAFHKYATLDVPDEDAAEADALAMFLSEDPLGDSIDVLLLEFPVEDPEQLQIQLLSSRQLQQTRGDLSRLVEEGQPPPRSAFNVFDRPPLEEGAPLVLDSFPRMLGRVLLFGRQTDRPARLVVPDVLATDRDAVVALLTQVGGSQLGPAEHEHVVASISQSASLLSRNWLPPTWANPEDLGRCATAGFEQAMYDAWPQMPLGRLGGKSPREAAADPSTRRTVMGAVLVWEHFVSQAELQLDTNRLRIALGLPELAPIDPAEVKVERLPLTRLGRVVAEKVSDQSLLPAFRRALAFRVGEASEKLARQLIARPSVGELHDRLQAYSFLAHAASEPEQSYRYVDEARRAAEAAGQSSATWDFLEMSLRFRYQDLEGVSRLLEHLRAAHLREPGVAQTLNEWLTRLNAIASQYARAGQAPEAAPAGPGVAMPGETPAEPGKLWTPDAATPASGDKPKIWTPDMG